MKKRISAILTAIVLTVIMTLSPMTTVLGAEQTKTDILTESSGIKEAIGISDASGIITETGCETLDAQAFDSLRIYYNDETLSDEDLFDRYVNLKKSYITALDNLYGAGAMAIESSQAETAIHIFHESQETLFGQDSSVYLYNIAVYKGLEKSEQTCLILLIPVRSTNSVVTVNLFIPREQLGDHTADNVASILSDIVYDGLASQNEAPSVLKDTDLIEKVRAGIYPAASQESPVYTVVEDSLGGYTVSLPDSYVPFTNNRLGGILTYSSYKIDPHIILSIASKPLNNRQETVSVVIDRFMTAASDASDALGSTVAAPDTVDAVDTVAASDAVNILESGDALYGGNCFSYIHYTNMENDVETWYYDYYIQNNSRLYKMRLQSSFSEPGAIVLGQMEKILTSFQAVNADEVSETAEETDIPEAIDSPEVSETAGEPDMLGTAGASGMFTAPDTLETTEAPDALVAATVRSTPATVLYENREEGYSFQYPQSWTLQDISPGIDYDRLRLSVPGHSGTLEITFQESYSGNNTAFGSPEYIPPFIPKTSKLLFSDLVIDSDISTVYSLGVYVDDNGRNRLFSSVDILKGTKIYSLNITAGEYRTKSGYFDDENINKMIDMVISSFRAYDTPESKARSIAGETRNRKLVFLENTLRNLYDPYLIVFPAENTQPDGTTIVAVENTRFSGYYKVKLDYSARTVEVLERILKCDILQNELARLSKQFDGLTITGTYRNEAKMTFSIESVEEKNNAAGAKPAKVLHTFAVNARPKDGSIIWNTVKVADREDYIADCKAFVSSKFKSDIDVYLFGNSPFSDVDTYLQKGVDYRILAFYQGSGRSGFFMLSMNPATGAFTAKKSFIPLAHIVENAKYKYGIKNTETGSGLFSFDPETFILNVFTPENTASAESYSSESACSGGLSFDMQQFNVYYNLESDMIEFDKVTSPAPDTH